MSTIRHKPQEAAPRRQYPAAVVVPLVVFAFLAGAAAGYSLGRMDRDDCAEVLPATVTSGAHAYSATRATVQELSPQPEQGTGLRALPAQCID